MVYKLSGTMDTSHTQPALPGHGGEVVSRLHFDPALLLPFDFCETKIPSSLSICETNFKKPTWVGHHHQDAVRAVLDNVGDDELEDVDVALHQVEAALALLLASAGRHHHYLGVGCHAVVC